MKNISFFDLNTEELKITKPIRLIELFAGVGSQAMALKNIGANFTHHFVCEWDKYAITSYNAIHGTNFETSDITKLKGEDLNIINTDNFEYILTYSFPCQDLSLAGKRKGMNKDDQTRSGLLWEVERLLNECFTLGEMPQILLMENVPQVHGKGNIDSFNLWINALEKLGYKNYWKDLNSKHYGVAQNRNRCFMVSVLGEYRYEFPEPVILEKRLKDYLLQNVEEKWYLNENQIAAVKNAKFDVTRLSIQNENSLARTLNARDFKDPQKVEIKEELNLFEAGIKGYNRNNGAVVNIKGLSPTIKTMSDGHNEPKILEPIKVLENTKKGYAEATEGDSIDLSYPTSKTRRGRVGKQIAQTLLTTDTVSVIENFRIRKLLPLECWRLMGFKDKDFYNCKETLNNKFYKGKDKSNSQLYKQAGNSIVVNVLEEIFKEMIKK